MDRTEPVDVYVTSSPAEAEIIKGMLDAEGIEAEVTGESQGGLQGVTPEVTIMVRAEDAPTARRLIRVHQEKAAESAESEED
jgi:Putative prokaryotic signal transducing protein